MALGGGGRRHVGEDAAADGEGSAGREAKDKRSAASLAGVESGGIARAAGAAVTEGIVPISPAGYSERLPSTDCMGNT